MLPLACTPIPCCSVSRQWKLECNLAGLGTNFELYREQVMRIGDGRGIGNSVCGSSMPLLIETSFAFTRLFTRGPGPHIGPRMWRWPPALPNWGVGVPDVVKPKGSGDLSGRLPKFGGPFGDYVRARTAEFSTTAVQPRANRDY